MGLYQMTVSVIIFSMVVAGLGLFLADAAKQASVTMDGSLSDLNTSYTQYGQFEDLADKQDTQLKGGDVVPENSEAGIVRGSIGVAKDAEQAVNSTKTIIIKVSEEIGIPPIFIRGALLILAIAFIYLVVSIIFRWSLFHS